MKKRLVLLEKFKKLPVLVNSCLESSEFSFPERIDKRVAYHRGDAEADVTTASFRSIKSPSGHPIGDLRNAFNQAAQKTKFGETTIEQWDRIVQFAGSVTRRKAKDRRVDIVAGVQDVWEDRDPINLSAGAANDWFSRVLLERINEGAPFRHHHAILGDQGCGKSTLIKYLISKNAEELRTRNIVMSRFEFLKFWSEWRDDGRETIQCARDYMSFIHLRDLLLSHFFYFVNGNEYKLKIEFQLPKRLEIEIDRITSEVQHHLPIFGVMLDEEKIRPILAQCVASAQLGNHALMAYIKSLPHAQRMTMIAALWEDKCVVTIFDGIDSLKIEDAIQETSQWKAVQEIIRNRAWLSTPTLIREQGKSLENDSIIVIRKSTAALLEQKSGDLEQFGLHYYYHVAPINSRTAMVSVIRRALEDISDYQTLPSAALDDDTFNLMKVVQRTMLAIGRSEGGSGIAEDIYNLFDGNLRDLFEFVTATIDWSCREMLRNNFLDTQDYFETVPKLIDSLSSERGSDFLRHKSYRVVDQILLGKGSAFENAAAVVTTRDSLLMVGNHGGYIRSNPDHYGQIDNIFNYLNSNTALSVDEHAFLEKLRVIQLVWGDPQPQHEVIEKMRRLLGYTPRNDALLLLLMIKTGFLSVEIGRSALEFSVHLRVTSKAKLSVNSLIGNLAYVENIFHRTLFPKVLVEHISDRVRDANSIEWAIASIRNAFIFLTYFQHIETNAANCVNVPQHLKLFENVRRRLADTISNMTAALEWEDVDPHDERAARAQANANDICTGAIRQIELTVRKWQLAGAYQAPRPGVTYQ